MKAVIYARYSSDNQREESIEGQIRECTAFAEKNGVTILRHYIDRAFSAKTDNRPEFQNMIKDSSKRLFDMVIVWKLDRLSRSQKDMLVLLEDVFLKNGCNFISLMESFDTATPFGRCIVGILAAFAQMERENIKSRMMMGKHAGLKEGRYFSSRAPIGYQW